VQCSKDLQIRCVEDSPNAKHVSKPAKVLYGSAPWPDETDLTLASIGGRTWFGMKPHP